MVKQRQCVHQLGFPCFAGAHYACQYVIIIKQSEFHALTFYFSIKTNEYYDSLSIYMQLLLAISKEPGLRAYAHNFLKGDERKCMVNLIYLSFSVALSVGSVVNKQLPLLDIASCYIKLLPFGEGKVKRLACKVN
jgi:hypothetical protein